MFRRTGIASIIALGVLVCCGQTAPQGCKSQPQPSIVSTGDVVGAVAVVAGVVIGTVVLVHVHHSHHTIKGCVVTGPGGLQVQSADDHKTYTLTGATPNLKVGDLVRVHGSKLKKAKGDPADQTFMVEKLNKDYGPCKALPQPPAAATKPAE